MTLRALTGLIFLAGCAYPGELRMELNKNVRIPKRRVLVFFVDGMRKELADRMLREGRLPNIQKYLYDRGCHADYAVTSIPSITFADIGSMNTGRFPGHHEILGNKWFDRVLGQYQNYMSPGDILKVDHDLRAPTIYEMLPDKYTVTIQTPIRRGATRPYDNWMSSGLDWFCGRYEAVDELAAQRFEDIAKSSEITGRWPDYIFAYFPAVDHIGHQYGACSKQYEEAFINFDAQIGRICRGLEKNHLLEEYYLILLSDHGHEFCKRETRWMPDEFFEDNLNLSIIDERFIKNGEPVVWQNYLKKYRIAVVTGGPRIAHIFLRCGEYWDEEPTFDQVEHFLRDFAPKAFTLCKNKNLSECLADQPAVAMVAMKEKANIIRIITHTGSARIIRQLNGNGTKEYLYQPIQHDPLNYRSHKSTAGMVATGYYCQDDWLQASCDSGFPDFVPQICEVFDSDRAGQIMLFAASGWAFSKRDFGGHGSVIPSDMNVTFAFAGPGIAKGKTFRTARIVDLVPTVLEMLGCSDRLKNVGPLDGKSLMPILKAKP
jgi:predicted AlkP superfamily pyrophosphatase or phosphodiesterase